MTEGCYHDGRKAESHRVTVSLGDCVLTLRDADGLTKARWPYAEICWLGEERFGRTDERLILSDPDLVRSLRRRLPKSSRREFRRMIAIAAAAAASVILFFWLGLPLIATLVARMVPPQWEQASGLWLEKQIATHLAHGRMCMNRGVVTDLVVERLSAGKAPRLPLSVTVLDSKIVNAVALPGGRIIIFRGLIDFIDHPNELAGIIAHEMAHAELRHPTEVAIERTGGAMLVTLLVGDVLGGSAFGFVAQTALSSSYTREAEREADALALAMMREADLDPAPLASFFARLAERERNSLPDSLAFLETHPSSSERAEAAGSGSGRGVVLDGHDWQTLKGVCRVLGPWLPLKTKSAHGR